jgi:hypothetical protein
MSSTGGHGAGPPGGTKVKQSVYIFEGIEMPPGTTGAPFVLDHRATVVVRADGAAKAEVMNPLFTLSYDL